MDHLNRAVDVLQVHHQRHLFFNWSHDSRALTSFGPMGRKEKKRAEPEGTKFREIPWPAPASILNASLHQSGRARSARAKNFNWPTAVPWTTRNLLFNISRLVTIALTLANRFVKLLVWNPMRSTLKSLWSYQQIFFNFFSSESP